MNTRLAKLLAVNLLFLCCASISAKRATKEAVIAEPSSRENNNSTRAITDWRQWISYAFRPPSRKEVEEGLEARWKQLEEDIALQHNKMQQHMEKMNENAQNTVNEIEQSVETQKKKLKKHIFKQHEGWKRFRTSARAQVGIVVGGVMTFAGGALSETIPSLQAAQLTWSALDKYNITRGLHDPWLKDAAAAVLAVSLIHTRAKEKSMENTSGKPGAVDRAAPLLTIGLSIVQSVGIIVDNYQGDVSPMARSAIEIVAAVVGTAAPSLLPVPLTVVAASVGGAVLLYQSIVSEVVANWFHMLERMDKEKRRKIEKGIVKQGYHQLEKKLLYPVKNAYEEVRAAVHNQTLAEPTLRDKVHEAIKHSMQVKLVWSCAALGVVCQVLWQTKPVHSACTAVRGWWTGMTTPQPQAIKKRR